MSTKHLLALGAAALVVVLAAVFNGLQEEPPATLSGGRLYPGLEARVNEVTAVDVELGDGVTLEIGRGEQGWTVRNRDDYPADVGQLRKLLLALARTEKVEQKTANPEFYERLGVQDIDQGGEQTRVVRVRAGDETLAHLIVGNTDQGGNSYLRRVGERESWLGSEWLDVPARVSAWLDAKLLEIDAARIASVEVLRAGEPPVRIVAGEEGLQLQRDGTTVSADSAELQRVVGALGSLNLEDLAEADTAEEAPDDGAGADAWHYTRFVTREGLGIAAQSRKQGDDLQVRLTAELQAAEPSEELQQEAERLNERFAGRTFVVASYLESRLAPTLEALRDKTADAGGESSAAQ